MGWRDIYKVHPVADVFPMLPDEELAELAEDIKLNGLKVPIAYTVIDGEKSILDGRNRLEAMERAGIEMPFGMLQPFTCCADYDTAASTIISVNIKRRHLTKQQQADLIVAVLKAADLAKAEAEKGCQVGIVSAEPHKGGRGKVNETKAKAIAEGEKQGIGKRTMQRALATAGGKKPSKRRHRRDWMQIERDKFDRFIDHLDFLPMPDMAPDLLTQDQRAHGIKIMETHIMLMRKVVNGLKALQ